MSLSITEFAGDTLYLDTMVFHVFLRSTGSDVESLFRRIRSREISAFTSVLTFDELAYRLLLALIRDKYGGSPLDQLRRDERALIAEFYPRIEPGLTLLQQFPNLSLVDISPADLRAMHNNSLRYHLRPRDSIHLAAMQKIDCLHIVSEDSDFDHVPDIQRYTLT